MPNNRNILYAVIGALVIVVAVLGYQLYQDRKEPKGFRSISARRASRWKRS